MIILDRMLVGGLRFVLDKLVQAADTELNDEGALREELLRAQMRHELGELSAGELAEVETAVMDRLREIRARQGGGGPIEIGRGGGAGEALKVASVEATFTGELHQAPEPAPAAAPSPPAAPSPARKRRTRRRS